jgi:hypothetical protein
VLLEERVGTIVAMDGEFESLEFLFWKIVGAIRPAGS